MRIIAGELRSRRLKSVPGLTVRPTPDRLRESLFSILAPQIPGSVFLDAYAGSGAVGLEALSRGAREVILIERDPTALAVIRENVAALGVGGRVRVLRGKASILIAESGATIAFVDPPYEKTAEYELAIAALEKTACRIAIAQHPSRLAIEAVYGSLARVRIVRQGDNALSFYERGRDPA